VAWLPHCQAAQALPPLLLLLLLPRSEEHQLRGALTLLLLLQQQLPAPHCVPAVPPPLHLLSPQLQVVAARP
jgi:hypothetical protein